MNESGETQGRFLLSNLDPPGEIPRRGRLLDFGCGGGVILRLAQSLGWEAEGFEVSQAAVTSCRAQGLKVSDRLEGLRKHHYDAIVLSHVLEHVPKPGDTLTLVEALLAPGGRLLIEVPNVLSLRARLALPVFCRKLNFDERRAFPTHLHYFSLSTLRKLLEKHGFLVAAQRTAGFGLEELVLRPERPSVSQPDAPRSESEGSVNVETKAQAGGSKAVKVVIKRVFFGLGWGEYLVVVARLTSSR